MPTITDEAVCIRLMDWSETSQIVVLMTADHGKIAATAKGAKRTTPSTLAKFSGGVELLTVGEAVFIVKPTTELANLIEWDLRDACWHLRRNLRAYQIAMYSADLVHHLVSDHDPHPATYAALRALLSELADPATHGLELLRFQWRLIDDLGYKPVLDRDAQTGRPIDESAATVAFSAIEGGLVADTGEADRWRMRRATLDALRAVAANGPLPGDDEAIWRANRLLCVYYRAILDKQLPTMRCILEDGPTS